MQKKNNDVILSREKFVKYLNKDFPGQIEKREAAGLKSGSAPLASVIIPTLDGYRSGYFPELLKQINNQTFQDFELIIAQADPYQGRAINAAASLARGEILIIMDDDTRLGHNSVFANLVNALKYDPAIGMAGVSNLIPEHAPWLVRRTMMELPRRHSALVDKVTDSDMAEHPCCAMPKKVFYEIGGEREDIRRGLDPYLRYILRRRGYRVVVIPDTWIYHLPPDTFPKLVKQLFRNGVVVGLDRRTHRQAPYEVPEGHISDFPPQRNFIYRLARFLWRTLKSLLTFRFISLMALLLYALGFIYGRFFKRHG
jgi:glycosyltransferase involved in cell wall biosynthesis